MLETVRRYLARLDEDIKELLLWGASALLGVAVGFIHSLDPTRFNSFYAGLAFAVLFRTLVYAWKVNRTTKRQTEALARIEDGAAFATLQLNVSELPALLRETALRILDKYRRAIESEPPGFTIAAENWAFASNKAFWDVLIGEQEKRRTSQRPAIRVKVTHSTAIELWDRNLEVQDLLARQGRFVELGGQIRRIFIAHDTAPTPAHLRVMSMMKDLGIDVAYAPLSAVDAEDLSYDFTLVEELEIVMKWYAEQPGRMVTKCELNRLSSDIVTRWNAIDRVAKPLADFDPTRTYVFAKYHHGYYLSTDRQAREQRVIATEWTVSSLPTVTARVKYGLDSEEFAGPIEIIGNQVHVLLRRNDGQERWNVVFENPLNEGPDIVAVYSGTSARQEPVAGLLMLSREKRTDDEVKKRLGEVPPIFATG
jgi:hypothetical protein